MPNIIESPNEELEARDSGDGEVDRVVTLTLEGIPHDATHWSTRAMATRSDLRLTRLALG